jgi:hypothetical protein
MNASQDPNVAAASFDGAQDMLVAAPKNADRFRSGPRDRYRSGCLGAQLAKSENLVP